DRLSWLGLALSAVAAGLFLLHPAAGALALALAGLCDTLDGLLARQAGMATPAGAFLDSVLDRYGEVLVMTGIWGSLIGRGQGVVLATLCILAALSGSLLVSYTRARGEGLGVACTEGWLQRSERLLVLIAAGLLDGLAPGQVLLAAVTLIALGSHLTAADRFRVIRRQLLTRDSGPG
ncbi:MAG: CDP-alcohol phosphatidyltransferase family protein, partial [Thermodesulfobacteriota bacterium]